MANEFKDFDYVLGYELINEPFAGDFYESFSILLPGLAGHLNLAPLYEKTAKAIREVDDQTLIFYEPVTWGYFTPMQYNEIFDMILTDAMDALNIFTISDLVSQVCGPMQTNNETSPKEKIKNNFKYQNEQIPVLGTGFSHVPGGPEYNNRSVLSWHYYCELFDSKIGNNTVQSILIQIFCDSIFGPNVFETVKVRTEEIGGGSMLTEFGLCYPNISDPLDKNTIECNRVLDLADSYFQSWTYWDFAPFWNENGDIVQDLVSVFSRPYPMATAGIPKKIAFDFTNKEFHFEFIIQNVSANTEPTEIFIPPLVYPNSQFDIVLSDTLSWMFSQNDPNIIFVVPKSMQTDIEMEQLVYIKIQPVVRIFRSGG